MGFFFAPYLHTKYPKSHPKKLGSRFSSNSNPIPIPIPIPIQSNFKSNSIQIQFTHPSIITMFLEVEVAAQGRREWVPAEEVPGTPRPSCPTWIEQPSPRPAAPLPEGPTWVEPPSPRLTAASGLLSQASSAQASTERRLNEFPPRPKPRAAVLAMGRATPPNKITQSTYTDWYFKVTGCEEKVELKQKMQRICKFVLFP